MSIEGGGAWVVGGRGVAHFLFADEAAARAALEAAGIRVSAEREVIVQRLQQAVPGQLGALTLRMADAGVNIRRAATTITSSSSSSTSSTRAGLSARPGCAA